MCNFTIINSTIVEWLNFMSKVVVRSELERVYFFLMSRLMGDSPWRTARMDDSLMSGRAGVEPSLPLTGHHRETPLPHPGVESRTVIQEAIYDVHRATSWACVDVNIIVLKCHIGVHIFTLLFYLYNHLFEYIVLKQ